MKASCLHRLSISAVALAAVCVASNVMALPSPISGPIVDPANGHTYYLLSNSDWTNAQAEAVTLGGNLATVDDTAENAWISGTFSNFSGVTRNLWIGLNAAGLNGSVASNYQWVDGSTSTYRNWSPPDPGFAGNQYVYIIPGGNTDAGTWNNVPNQTIAGYQFGPMIPNFGVVEIVPEPSACLLALLGSCVILWKVVTSRTQKL